MSSTKGTRFAVCGAGFIGKSLLARLLEEGAAITVLDHNAAPPEIAPGVLWIQGEFSDPAVLADALAGVDVAYHLISSTVPGDDHIDIVKELSENIVSTLRFIESCFEARVKRIVFVSSASVYGIQETMPVPESASTDPISSHGIHKLTIEKYLGLSHFLRGMDVRIVRLSNPYGPGQDPNGRQGFVAIAAGKLASGSPLLLRGGGSAVRDFIFIEDVARALELAGTVERAPILINIGTGEGHTLSDVLARMEAITGFNADRQNAETRRVDVPASVLDVTVAGQHLGFAPSVSLDAGLRATLTHYGLPVRAEKTANSEKR